MTAAARAGSGRKPALNLPGCRGCPIVPLGGVTSAVSSSLTTTTSPPGADPAGSVCVLDSEQSVQAVLESLEDADCRRILESTDDDALSAKEVSEVCGLPLSTAYRKLERLTDVGLLGERTRIDPGGKHASEYRVLVDDVAVSLHPDAGLAVSIAYRDALGSRHAPRSRGRFGGRIH